MAAKGPAFLHAHVAAAELSVLPQVDWAAAAGYGLVKFKKPFATEPAAA